MKKLFLLPIIIMASVSIAILLAYAQTGPPSTTGSSISQPLVREGTLAIKLAGDLKLGITENEAEAEDLLSGAGIEPRNGWIADYPVTPDIIGELQAAIGIAADSGKISVEKNAALQVLQDAVSSYGLSLTPDTSGRSTEDMSAPNYPDATASDTYYDNEGPPAVTYYAPPPDYAYLYDWVPYPFWWYDFWFPGFFVLTDFHIRVHWHHHGREHEGFVSNHFRDHRTGGTIRIDPSSRFQRGTSPSAGGTRWSSPAVRGGTQAGIDRSRKVTRPAPLREFRGYGVTPNHEGARSSAFDHSVNRRVEHESSDRGFRSRTRSGQIPRADRRSGGTTRGGSTGTSRSGGSGGFHGGGHR